MRIRISGKAKQVFPLLDLMAKKQGPTMTMQYWESKMRVREVR